LNNMFTDDMRVGDEEMKKLLFDPARHNEVQGNLEESLEDLRNLLDENFNEMTFGDAQNVP